MSKADELKQLFDDWKAKKPDQGDFYRDGILDEQEWEKASPKILYILKEVNEASSTVYSIATLLADGVKAETLDKGFVPTWANVIRWTYGLTKSVFNYSNIPEFQKIRMVLLKCGILNLKKTRGGSSAIADQVGDAAGHDKEEIRQEIAIIKPDIIVCCGTYDIVKWRVFDPNIPDYILKTGNKCFWGKCGDRNYLFFNHYHPNSRTMRSADMYNVLAFSILCAQKERLISIEGYKNIPMVGPFLD